MVLPITYPEVATPAVASYDWTELAEGTGIKKFYGFSSDTTPITYKLGTNVLYSNVIETTYTGTGWTDAFSKKIDYNFDLATFNLPRTIKGTSTTNFCIATIRVAPGSYGATWYYVIRIRKWDGSSETEIAAQTSAEKVVGGAHTSAIQIFCSSITIPKTPFKKGETLRYTFEVWIKRTNAGNDPDDTITWTLGHDPQNRDGTKIIPSTDTPVSMTKLEFNCPFDIDI